MNKKIVKSIFCRLFADFKFSTKLDDFYDLEGWWEIHQYLKRTVNDSYGLYQ